MHGRSQRFDRFVTEVEPGLRRALVAAYGPDVGREATAGALAWAWANWDRTETFTNPAGYLYRVGQSEARRVLRWSQREIRPPVWPDRVAEAEQTDVDLVRALAALPERQHVAVVLVHGHGHTLADAAEILGCGVSTLRNHLRRGLARLGRELGAEEEHDRGR